MLSEFDIINMNGRLYAPVLGRFFSPDNYVLMPLRGVSMHLTEEPFWGAKQMMLLSGFGNTVTWFK